MASAHSMSIHDFHGVELSFEAAAGGFANYVTESLLAHLVADAWWAESRALEQAVSGRALGPPPTSVRAWVGRPRPRLDALILPIAWSGEAGEGDRRQPIVPIEADLELVAFGRARSHLHLLGVSRLRPGTAYRSSAASLEQRLAVAVVRHVLASLADSLESAAGVGRSGSSPGPVPLTAPSV